MREACHWSTDVTYVSRHHQIASETQPCRPGNRKGPIHIGRANGSIQPSKWGYIMVKLNSVWVHQHSGMLDRPSFFFMQVQHTGAKRLADHPRAEQMGPFIGDTRQNAVKLQIQNRER